MKYYVFRKSLGEFHWVATTAYREDAEAILERWYSGYIADSSGAKVVEKRL